MTKTTTRGKEPVTYHLRSPSINKRPLRKKIKDIGTRHSQISHMDTNTEQFIHHRHKLSKKVDKYLTQV